MNISNLTKGLAMGAVLACMAPMTASADESAELVIDGVTLVTRTAAPDHMNIDEIISGWVFRSDETQAMQMDDFDNPGMLLVDAAAADWATVEGEAGESCQSCHGDPSSMAGVRTVMPRYNEAAGDLWSLEEYINNCRTERMQAEAWGWNSEDMISMTGLISLQSRGMVVNVAIDGPATPYWEQGREMYYTRYGQLELACANCHEDNYGNLIRADHLSQGQTNGFPAYRLKTTGLNSIHNRFRGCIRDTRAETFAIGSPELKALELYVASRGNGLSVEGPSVRN